MTTTRAVDADPQIVRIEGWTANGYLIVGQKIVVVDPGVPRLVRSMLHYVEHELKRPASDISWATVTHYHNDHVGGMGLLQQISGCQVALPALARPFVEQGARIPFPRPLRWLHMLAVHNRQRNPTPTPRDAWQTEKIGLPLISPRPKFDVHAWLDEGDALPDAPGFTALFTPGHSADSTCLWHEQSGSLFSGDMLLGNFEGPPQANAYCLSRTKTIASLQRLADLPIKRLFPGHGPLHSGEYLAKEAVETLRTDLV
ncbi:MAG: MBL fold metallo-hydrolase [Candidatus Alcyoniella australis]|nr:MBL fold metallo-hydrolase [Candidatus Alcyoniella australis]